MMMGMPASIEERVAKVEAQMHGVAEDVGEIKSSLNHQSEAFSKFKDEAYRELLRRQPWITTIVISLLGTISGGLVTGFVLDAFRSYG